MRSKPLSLSDFRNMASLRNSEQAFEKATSVKLDRSQSCGEAFRIITGSCIRQIIANEPGMCAGHAEALHQLRVGLRRLRAAIKAFAKMTADPEQERIKAELKWVMKQIGPARDLDVFGTDVLEPLRRIGTNDLHLAAAHRSYSEMRKLAHESARRSIDSDRFRKIMLDLAEWIEVGRWTTDPALKTVRECEVTEHAAEILARWSRRFRKRGKKLSDLSPQQRHSLRMRAKDCATLSNSLPASLAERNMRSGERRVLQRWRSCRTRLAHSMTLPRARESCPPKEINQSAHARRLMATQESKAVELLAEVKAACAKFGKVKPFWK
jgi:triphosphatase